MKDSTYTTIEQSKHLLTAGLKPETADFQYSNGEPDNLHFISNEHDEDDVPCWSISSLIDLIPGGYTIVKHPLNDKIVIWTNGLNSGEQETLLNDCFNIVISLLENKLI